jgi:hypothetical protein
LQQSHAADAVNQRMVHLGVEREPVVFQPFNNMAFPERTGEIQRVGMQAGNQNAQFTFAAGAWKCRVADVVIKVDLFVDLPGRHQQATQVAGERQLVTPGWGDLSFGLHSGQHVAQKGFRCVLR